MAKRTRRTNAGHVADTADALTMAHAVAMTGLSERTIRRRIKAEALTSSKVSGRLVLSRVECEALAAQLGRSTPKADTSPPDAGQVADNGGQALLVLTQQREENRALVGAVLDLNRQLDDSRNLLTGGQSQVAELGAKVAAAEASKLGAWVVAGVLAVVAIALTVALVYR